MKTPPSLRQLSHCLGSSQSVTSGSTASILERSSIRQRSLMPRRRWCWLFPIRLPNCRACLPSYHLQDFQGRGNSTCSSTSGSMFEMTSVILCAPALPITSDCQCDWGQLCVSVSFSTTYIMQSCVTLQVCNLWIQWDFMMPAVSEYLYDICAWFLLIMHDR